MTKQDLVRMMVRERRLTLAAVEGDVSWNVVQDVRSELASLKDTLDPRDYFTADALAYSKWQAAEDA